MRTTVCTATSGCRYAAGIVEGAAAVLQNMISKENISYQCRPCTDCSLVIAPGYIIAWRQTISDTSISTLLLWQ